jgi:hypothetical protein
LGEALLYSCFRTWRQQLEALIKTLAHTGQTSATTSFIVSLARELTVTIQLAMELNPDP